MSELQLNEPVVDYKAFLGRNTEQMPLLIADGRTPLSVVGLMKRRLEVLSGSEAVRNSWWYNSFDTGDGAVRHSDGRLKVVPDVQYLRSLNPAVQLVDGAVPLTDDFYNGLVGVEEFSAKQVETYFNKALNRREAEENPGWLALFRGDKALQKEVVGVTFAQAKERFGYDGKMMGVYHQAVPKEGAAGRLWFVGWVYGNFYGSRADGNYHLGSYGYGGGRLVGVAPEAQRVPGRLVGPTLEQTVNAVLSAGQKHVAEATRVGFERDVGEALKPFYK